MRAGAAFAIVVTASCATTAPPPEPVLTPDGVRFALTHPGARSVAVAGSFNQWSASSHPLAQAEPGGPWTAIVALPPGEHLFMYVVDGEWLSPPRAEYYRDDGFGAKNGVVAVGPNGR